MPKNNGGIWTDTQDDPEESNAEALREAREIHGSILTDQQGEDS